MLGFLGLGKIQLIVATAMVVVIGGLYWWNSVLRTDLRTSEQNNAKLELAVEEQKAAIELALANAEDWQKAYEDLELMYEELAGVHERASAEVNRLQDIFARHDLSALALARPGLIEQRINAGTADALSMLERASAGDLLDPGGGGEATGAGDAAGP